MSNVETKEPPKIGDIIKVGRSNYIVVKVNTKTLRCRQVWDRAVPGTNRRRMSFGDFITLKTP